MPPISNIRKVGLAFDLDLWPTDLNVNRDHLLIKDYLPTKYEASGAKFSRVIRCTRFERLTWPLTLDLLTWLSIGSMYLSMTIYLPSLKLLGQSVVELSVAQCLEDWHDLWPWPSTYRPDYQKGSSTHQGLSTCQGWSFWGKALLSYQLHNIWETDMTFDLGLWPIDLTINRNHLLIKDYLPTKVEACGAKCCWVIRCTIFGRLTWPLTYWPDYQ